jgi:hypothetical protein
LRFPFVIGNEKRNYPTDVTKTSTTNTSKTKKKHPSPGKQESFTKLFRKLMSQEEKPWRPY